MEIRHESCRIAICLARKLDLSIKSSAKTKAKQIPYKHDTTRCGHFVWVQHCHAAWIGIGSQWVLKPILDLLNVDVLNMQAYVYKTEKEVQRFGVT